MHGSLVQATHFALPITSQLRKANTDTRRALCFRLAGIGDYRELSDDLVFSKKFLRFWCKVKTDYGVAFGCPF
jgi:hypothetical protein